MSSFVTTVITAGASSALSAVFVAVETSTFSSLTRSSSSSSSPAARAAPTKQPEAATRVAANATYFIRGSAKSATRRRCAKLYVRALGSRLNGLSEKSGLPFRARTALLRLAHSGRTFDVDHGLPETSRAGHHRGSPRLGGGG